MVWEDGTSMGGLCRRELCRRRAGRVGSHLNHPCSSSPVLFVSCLLTGVWMNQLDAVTPSSAISFWACVYVDVGVGGARVCMCVHHRSV